MITETLRDKLRKVLALAQSGQAGDCNLSIYADHGLTPQEKVLLDMIMKGYTREEVAVMMGYSVGRFPVKLYNIASKLRDAYYD